MNTAQGRKLGYKMPVICGLLQRYAKTMLLENKAKHHSYMIAWRGNSPGTITLKVINATKCYQYPWSKGKAQGCHSLVILESKIINRASIVDPKTRVIGFLKFFDNMLGTMFPWSSEKTIHIGVG